MKKFTSFIFIWLICLLSFIYVLFIPLVSAEATSTYLRVTNQQATFYANANEQSALFYLPYTYYVKSLGEVGEFTHVECYGVNGGAALDGYVKTAHLFDDGLIVNNPFVSLTITTATTSTLFADATLLSPTQYVFAERTMRYYGSYLCGETTIYYVEYNGKLGYVKEADVYPFAIPNHPNELTFLPKEELPEIPPEVPSERTTASPEAYLSLKIIIIGCLLFAGIVALVLALKQKPNKQVAAGYYDENDYE
jgi:hypothetical protein